MQSVNIEITIYDNEKMAVISETVTIKLRFIVLQICIDRVEI
jgi:hypothetical protein